VAKGIVKVPPVGCPNNSVAKPWPRREAGELSSGPRVKSALKSSWVAGAGAGRELVLGILPELAAEFEVLLAQILSNEIAPMRVSVTL